MVHQLPIGAKDLLPLDVLQKQWIEQRLQQTFQAWGYQKIITPSIEKLETLTAGGAVQPQSVIQLQGDDGEFLGLRPEFTASIARAYAARLGDNFPQRLYYNANVFRQDTGAQETFQAGVELLGTDGQLADSEILLLLADCLATIKLTDWQVVLGHAGLTTALLDIFPIRDRVKIRNCFAQLDRVGLEQIADQQTWGSLAIELLQMRGTPLQVLNNLERMLTTIQTEHGLWWQNNAQLVTAEISHLRSLLTLWQEMGLPDRLTLDLSLIQSFDYYTGIVFEVVSEYQAIAQGGRYDQLLGLYHPKGLSHPGIGFCLNLEHLQKVSLAQLPHQVSVCNCLVVPESGQFTQSAFAYAAKLREDLTGIEVYLAFDSAEQVKMYGRSRNVQEIAWVGENIRVESLEMNQV
jgi:ATP phosphoribosyltransferase regulatory subunit